MNINPQSVKMKIDHYCEKNGLSQKDFADRLSMSRQALSNMVTGKQNFTQTFFVGIMQKFPDINLYDLFDNDTNNVSIVREVPHEYGKDARTQALEKALRDIAKIVEKTQI